MAIGYGIGLPLVMFSFYHDCRYHPTLEASLRRMETVPIEWTQLIYPFQRVPPGDGSRRGHHRAVSITIRAATLSPPRSCRANGAHKLYNAINNMHVYFFLDMG